jgi:hypothetical protein
MRAFPLVLAGATALVVLSLQAPTARADGPPVGASQDLVDQIWSTNGAMDYVVTKEPETTLVQARDPATRAVVHQVRLRGQLGLPQVSVDPQQGLGGLSPDGRTLVLQRVRTTYPEPTSRFVLVDTTWRTRPRSLTLRGDLAFDALSPHAATLYLIQDRRSRSSRPTRCVHWTCRAGGSCLARWSSAARGR